MIVFIGISATVLVLVSLLVFIGNKLSKKMKHKRKQWWIISHVLFVIIYFSGLFGQLLVVISATFFTDKEYIFVALKFIGLFDNFLIIPGTFGALITGIWLAIRTNWGGLTKYYWIITKWVGNISAMLLGSSITGSAVHNLFPKIISSNIHPLQNPVYFESRQMLFFGIGISFFILISLVVISYKKPWGKCKKYRKNQKSARGS